MKEQDLIVKAEQGGFSLVEVLLVLSVAAAVFAGATVLWKVSDASQKETRFISSVTELVRFASLHTAGYGVSGSPARDSLASVYIARGRIAQSLSVTETNGTKTLSHIYGGAVLMASDTDGWRVTFRRVPKNACIAYLASQPSKPSGKRVSVNRLAVQANSVQDAVRACADTNEITVTSSNTGGNDGDL